MREPRQKQSAVKFILLGLIPYSRQNLMLSFKPNLFFNELQKESKYSKQTLRQAYGRAQRRGFIEPSIPRLTKKGYLEVQPFLATRFKNDAQLMVIFDIPERYANLRQQFRSILKQWGFKLVQKSVWVSDKDYRGAILDVISELEINDYVETYECSRLSP